MTIKQAEKLRQVQILLSGINVCTNLNAQSAIAMKKVAAKAEALCVEITMLEDEQEMEDEILQGIPKIDL